VELRFGKVHYGAGNVIQIVCKDVQSDIGDGLDDFAIRQAGGTCLLKVRVADFTTLHDNVACQFQNGIGLGNRCSSMARVCDFPFRKPRSGTDERVHAQAVAAQVAAGDGEGDLLPELGTKARIGERAAEIEIGLKGCGRIAEHAENVRKGAKLSLQGVKELFGPAGCLRGVKLSDAVHILY